MSRARFDGRYFKSPRHKELIDEVRRTGARIQLIGDGDVAAPLPPACLKLVWIFSLVSGSPEGLLPLLLCAV